MKLVVVILEHDGTGHGSAPIATIELPEGNPANDWPVQQWLRNHDWAERVTPDGYRWTRRESGLYGDTVRYAAISEPMRLEEA